MAWEMRAASGEKNNTAEFPSVQSDATITATSPLAGTYSYNMSYSKDANNDIICRVMWNDLPLYKNSCHHFLLSTNTISGSANLTLLSATGFILAIDSTQHLVTNFSTTMTTALTTATKYRIEVRDDETGTGRVYVRLYNSSGTLLEEISAGGLGSPASASISYGMSDKEFGGTDPNVNFKFDDMISWYSPSGEDATPFWPNAQKTHIATVERGTVTHDDYTGVTNNTANQKSDNVDDISPSDGDTTYNQSTTTIGATDKQTHHAIDGPTPGAGEVINGVQSSFILKLLSASSTQGTWNIIVRDNATNYLREITGVASTYNVKAYGLRYRPGGSTAWDTTSRNALEVGSQALTSYISTFEGTKVGLPTGDGATNDGVWTVSSGSGSAYTVVDENISSAEVNDYISSTTVGQRQGFTFPTPTVDAGCILAGVALALDLGGGFTTGLEIKGYYKPTSGVYYYTDTYQAQILSTIDHTFVWQTNPATAAAWTAAEISAAGTEFGVEVTGGSGEARVHAFNIDLLQRSELRETTYWLTTVYGPAVTEVLPPGKIIQVKQAVNRSGTY